MENKTYEYASVYLLDNPYCIDCTYDYFIPLELRGEVYIGAYYEEKMVLSINEGAFRGRTGITGVYLLDGILAIESGAFEDCTNMEKIDIPATVVRIGEGAFKGCKSLKTLVLPNSLVEIEDGAFEGCESLEEIVFGEIEDESQTDKNKNKPQNNTALGEVEEEKPSITRIGARAFRGCKNLKSVMLPEGLLKIDALAFSGCESLTEIVIPESVENIAMGVFDTDSLTINLYFSEGEMPEGFSIGWYIGQGVTLVYDYQPPEPEVDEPVDEPWWNLGGGNKDGDKNSNNK